MKGHLEQPESEDELYLARADEVVAARRLMTGDVLSGIVIPGVATDPTLGMIVTHPCSMSRDGVNLIPKLHVALVQTSARIAWPSCPRDRMPLPSLRPGEFHVVRFDQMSMVTTSDLATADRLACMTVRGVNLLQHRLIWYFTRFKATTGHLNQLFAPVFDEVDLQEAWVEAATYAGGAADAAVAEFHDWIRADDGSGVRRQDRLKNPQSRSSVRRALQVAIKDRFSQ